MNSLRRGQRGFTLVELLVAIPIAALVVTAATGAIFQVLNSTRANNYMVAYRQVQTAGYWVSHDAIQAQNVTVPASPGFPFTLAWSDWEGLEHEIDYSLVAADLQRQETIGYDVTTTTVAQYVDSSQTRCEWDGSVVSFQVAATVGDQTATRTYEIKPRPLG